MYPEPRQKAVRPTPVQQHGLRSRRISVPASNIIQLQMELSHVLLRHHGVFLLQISFPQPISHYNRVERIRDVRYGSVTRGGTKRVRVSRRTCVNSKCTRIRFRVKPYGVVPVTPFPRGSRRLSVYRVFRISVVSADVTQNMIIGAERHNLS